MISKKKGHRQHRGQDSHNGRDDAVDLFFFFEITSEMAKILRLSPDAAKMRYRTKPWRTIMLTRL